MTINWYGHSCFRLEAKEGSLADSTGPRQAGSGQISILIDPFSKEVGLKPPKIKDDILLVSHEHFDHNNVSEAGPECFIIRNPGEYEKRAVSIKGIPSFHDKEEGKKRGPNTIYLIKAEEMTLCHLGDLGQEKLTDSQVEEIGDVDILMIPVGGNYTINYKEAVGVVSQIEPKVVIPMHYKIPGLTVDIEGPEKFIKELGLNPERVDRFKVSKKTLPAEEIKLVTFNI